MSRYNILNKFDYLPTCFRLSCVLDLDLREYVKLTVCFSYVQGYEAPMCKATRSKVVNSVSSINKSEHVYHMDTILVTI